jgi:hypothetical protein
MRMTHKNRKVKQFNVEVLGVLFLELKASPVAWKMDIFFGSLDSKF